ncbi:hypothetical protein C9374_004444 [Naegleria lovaniensis]|uniref:F-box domain-containing protein n=1 Tax=Naegleria lovaniensis TaxID=51637 RepID=A0AA88GRP9_NAELO|nr:uncharacterized protein C9374_004444 [Naegleria lovaniensis]KAG2383107.1 hypothetical protein C9374_004444 [Naegleria lovaniensis]
MISNNETLLLSLNAENDVQHDKILSTRLGHSAVFYENQIYFFGGSCFKTKNQQPSSALVFVNDLIQVDTYNSTEIGKGWKYITTNQINIMMDHQQQGSSALLPIPRNFHSAVCYHHEMIIFGGKSNGFLNDVWSFDFTESRWRKLQCKNSEIISPRYGHTSVVYGDSMFVFGGYDNTASTNAELFELNLKNLEWRRVALKNLSSSSLNGRVYHASVLDCENGDWYIVGGKLSHRELMKDFIKIKLSTLSTNDSSEEQTKCEVEYEFIDSNHDSVLRYGHSCVLEKIGTKKTLYIIGGCNNSKDFTNCYSLLLSSDESSDLHEFHSWKLETKHILSKIFEDPSMEKTSIEPYAAFPVFHTCTQYVQDENNTGNFSYFVFGGTFQKSNVSLPQQNSTDLVLSSAVTTAFKPQIEEDQEIDYKEFDLLLNDDIYKHILSYLDYSDLLRLQLVCKSLRICQLTEEDEFWECHYLKKIGELQKATVKHRYVLPDPMMGYSGYKYIEQHDPRFMHLSEVTSDYKKRLIDIFKTFLSNSDKNSKNLTSFIETISMNPYHNKLYTREEIMAYPNELVRISKDSSKIVIVGDGATGKTCLLMTLMNGEFPSDYVPTVYDFYEHPCKSIPHLSVGFWDTAGPEEYDRLRPLSYPNTDVFYLTFSINSYSSFKNIPEKWIPELRRYCCNVPIILVGTKTDLRQDPVSRKTALVLREEKPITYEQGELMSRHTGCIAYIEVSALKKEGINGLDELALKSICVSKSQYKPPKKCYLQ